MANEKLSLLSFPQKLEGGKLHVNILIIPRNINPLLAMDVMDPGPDVLPVFADTPAAFKCMIINSLDGLPAIANVNHQPKVTLINPITSSRNIWEALKQQLQATDGLTIDDTENIKPGNRAADSLTKFQEKNIRKYLPVSYRDSFNFTKARTKNVVTDDEYHCAVKNRKETKDTKTNRDKISWGKAIALCLRNPLLAEKAGLIYHGTIDLPANAYDEGGWLYVDFDASSAFSTVNTSFIKQYAARIPALKNVNNRTLFAAVQFPVNGVNNGGYDDAVREAILYDDGFAKIVHANQAVNHYLLEETDKTNPPMKDTGIRIGWDDEQITIWQNRQMTQKDEKTEIDVDTPLGVFSYCLDARTGGGNWLSQNSIVAPNGVIVSQGNINVANAGTVLELGTEVHASSHGDAQNEGFWLPMYFVNWIGNSIAIPDKDAEEINQLTSVNTKAVNNKYTDPANYVNEPDPNKVNDMIENYKKNNSINTIPKKTFHPYIQNPSEKLALIYGKDYDFRVRLMDLTGGTPATTKSPIHGAEKPETSWHFKRHTGAGPLNIKNIQDRLNALGKNDPIPDFSELEKVIGNGPKLLTIGRPTLGYPAVVFTDKYKAPNDAITRLKSILQNLPAAQQTAVNIGLPDPDVNSFKVIVEMRSLEMDNALSESGKESYVKLYEKTFQFSNDFNVNFSLKIVYNDFHKLPFDKSFADAAANDTLLLPTARNLRLTFIPIVDNADNNYADESIQFGKPVLLSSFMVSNDEKGLISPVDDGLKAIYLQPENAGHTPPAELSKDKQKQTAGTPVEMERMAEALGLVAKKLTIEGETGKRTQFGCSKLMRHSLSPDSSSVTFSSLSELFNHWIIGVQYKMQRDWSWDGLDVESFSVFRKMRYEKQANFGAEILVGTINVSRTANINDLTEAQRDHVNLVFLDALDPKQANDVFPDEVFLSYRIVPLFKQGVGAQHDGINPIAVHVPVTTIPHQIPKLISAGIALSPYVPDDKYATTVTRQKFLWLEMEEGPKDPNDSFFVRVLANAPDPMLCLVDDEIKFNNPEDPPLNINDEKIRVLIPGMNNDFAGVGAMQEMIPEQTASPRFFMLPLPPGLHDASDELFGFFSYEIRVGHKKELWSTAQARYGRPLKVNGVQHPAPALICNAFRRKYFPTPASKKQLQEIVITAPFANAVLNGKNVAPIPPHTSLWCFLYTQTKQADGKAYRNVLISSKYMPYAYLEEQEDEGTRYGSCSFRQEEISELLRKLGLPVTSALSVLCVEMFPLDNTWMIANPVDYYKTYGDTYLFGNYYNNYAAGPEEYYGMMKSNVPRLVNPLVDELGKYRIYRTSALVAVENICCEDC